MIKGACVRHKWHAHNETGFLVTHNGRAAFDEGLAPVFGT
jgi:hypothetical protein